MPYVKKIERDDISTETLGLLRRSVIYRLKHLSSKELSQLTYHKLGQWTARTRLEAWTARKVFRRFLWHEKLHMNTMKNLLSEYQSRT
ncbi:MAG TPA: hypothetical protein VNA15_05940 [Candidatus Angelobacter sp.]|nr:hypothetical protein [Candidatus Angelobacter sp.]